VLRSLVPEAPRRACCGEVASGFREGTLARTKRIDRRKYAGIEDVAPGQRRGVDRWHGHKHQHGNETARSKNVADMGMRLMGVLLFMPINSMAAPVALAVAVPSTA
jgi:hypothetical protein